MKLILKVMIFVLSFQTASIAHADWRAAYEDWKNTVEATEEIMQLVVITEVLSADLSDELLNTAMGNLEERALAFLNEQMPANKCSDYTKALFDIGAVIGELVNVFFSESIKRIGFSFIIHQIF